MEASKLRRFITWAVDTGCVLFLFLAMLRLLPNGLLKTEDYRLGLLGVMVFYYATTELAFKRTAGKLLMGTHLVTNDDKIPGTSQLLLRTLCRFIPLEPLSLLFSQQRLAWHDRLSATKVIYLDY